jgi:hypothetical protein
MPCEHPLNPLDVPFTPQRYDLISMPPVRWIHNVSFEGAYYEISGVVGSSIRCPGE